MLLLQYLQKPVLRNSDGMIVAKSPFQSCIIGSQDQDVKSVYGEDVFPILICLKTSTIASQRAFIQQERCQKTTII
ncbi:unnamed protein product [Leptidea sinapis]|uniref:Uncharacterized protein n=1 Tax=Leptidea sinapis TaxID=189913 RepID=A0A5E4QUB0_9NEOP|nr:unnamed protein product [Leptidea sinapis]